MSTLTCLNWGRPLVKLGEETCLHSSQLFRYPVLIFVSQAHRFLPSSLTSFLIDWERLFRLLFYLCNYAFVMHNCKYDPASPPSLHPSRPGTNPPKSLRSVPGDSLNRTSPVRQNYAADARLRRRLRLRFSRATDVRASAAADPRGFLALHPAPVIFDEVQYAPDLLPYIKESIDERRHEHGQYFLTGSQNLLLTENVTESLAGQAAMLRLLPLSLREETGRSFDPLPWEPSATRKKKRPAPADLWTNFLRGGYPELVAHNLIATLLCGTPATFRPTWSATSDRSIKSGILSRFRVSCVPSRRGPDNCSASPTLPEILAWR